MASQGERIAACKTVNPAIRNAMDPADIQILPKIVLLNQFISRMADHMVTPSKLRDKTSIDSEWDIWQKSRLIESILLRIPLPSFYVSANRQDDWAVFDGWQRSRAIFEFVAEDGFRLEGLEYFPALEGLTYSELPRYMKRRINETELSFNIVAPETPDAVVFNIFSRINSGNVGSVSHEISRIHREGAGTVAQATVPGAGSKTRPSDFSPK